MPKLTKRTIERATVPDGRRYTVLWDTEVRGFGCRVTATRRTYILQYRAGRGRDAPDRQYTIGRHGDWTLDQARAEATRLLGRIAEGADPQAERQAQKAAAAADASATRTFRAVADQYLERHVRRRLKSTTAREYEDVIRRELVPAWGDRDVTTIDRAAVLELLDPIEDRAPAMARLTFAVLRSLFSWGVRRGVVADNPCDGAQAPATPAARDRVLDAREIRLVWHAAGRIGYPYGTAVRLLLLTGQRRSEVASATWADIDFAAGVWTIPAEAAKNGRAHAVDLSPQALEVLRAIPGAAADYVITAGNGRVNGWSKAKQRLDRAAARLAADEGVDPPAPWRIHDLRRTAATGMAGLGHPPHIVERVLNHTSGATGGLVAVYQHHEYRPERRAALEAWGRRVAQLAEGGAADNVVDLRGHAAVE